MRRYKTFRFCMLVGAAALLAVSLYYFINYVVGLDVALANSSVQPELQASIRALWLAFGFQALLIGMLYALVAFRPPAVSREVIVLLGMLQLLEAVLLFTFAGNLWMALLLVAAAVFVLVGAMMWPTQWPPVAPAGTSGSLPAQPMPPHVTHEPDASRVMPTAPDLPRPADETLRPGTSPKPLR